MERYILAHGMKDTYGELAENISAIIIHLATTTAAIVIVSKIHIIADMKHTLVNQLINIQHVNGFKM